MPYIEHHRSASRLFLRLPTNMVTMYSARNEMTPISIPKSLSLSSFSTSSIGRSCTHKVMVPFDIREAQGQENHDAQPGPKLSLHRRTKHFHIEYSGARKCLAEDSDATVHEEKETPR